MAAMRSSRGVATRTTPDKTMQSKLRTEPPQLCKKCGPESGRRATANRKDQLCENCGHFADRGKRK
jgi:hypothetical protein